VVSARRGLLRRFGVERAAGLAAGAAVGAAVDAAEARALWGRYGL